MKAIVVVLWLSFFIVQVCSAATSDSFKLVKGTSYQEIKTKHAEFLARNPSKIARSNAIREMVRSSPYGERGLRMLNNFESDRYIDPTIPGVERSVMLLNSSSRMQTKGYMRELLYATSLNSDKRFKLVAMNQQRTIGSSSTDADIVARHKVTGMFTRIEVKDVSPASQKSGIRRLKRQIDKMAVDGYRRGELQYWVNRRPVIAEIKEYAEKNGIKVYGNVKTGKYRKGVAFREVRDDIGKDSWMHGRVRLMSGAAAIVFGAALVGNGVAGLVETDDVRARSTKLPGDVRLMLGQNISIVVAGSAMSSAGIASISRSVVGQKYQGGLTSVTRMLGVVAGGALVAQEGFYVSRYVRGDVSSREFWTDQWRMASGAAGSIMGAWGGGSLGAASGNPALAALGSVAGAGVGASLAGKLADQALDRYYTAQFKKLDDEFGAFVYASYGVN